MSEAALDPYAVLGVAPDISDIELRRVYRGLVKRYHPDHNGGSADSACRFAQIQNAYATIAQRRRGPGAQPASAQAQEPAGPSSVNVPGGENPIEDRIAALEHELAATREAEQRRAQERTRLAREQAARFAAPGRIRATPEELGYYSTDDSFTKIIDDAAEQLGERLRRSDAKQQFTRRLSDLFGRDS